MLILWEEWHLDERTRLLVFKRQPTNQHSHAHTKLKSANIGRYLDLEILSASFIRDGTNVCSNPLVSNTEG